VYIALLQETHLKIADVHRCQNRHYRIAASSSAPNKTKGVSILIKRNLKLNILESGADTNGKFCFIKCNFDSVKMCIFSVYAPNYQDASFYDSLKQVVLRHPDCIFLMGGGYNSVVDNSLDRMYNTQALNQSNASSNLLRDFLTDLNLIDPWRTINPSNRDYTFFSSRHKSYSRIDYIFMSPGLDGIPPELLLE
uniref:exodeoxyribonuclease III n=1 Tax=Astyanax mexicanus TaxID=7994 RepID=A0A8B9HZL3_ASTMX